MTFRRAVNEDAEAISALLHKAFVEFKQRYTDKAFNATAIPRREVLKRMMEGPVWVALENDKIIGTVGAVENEGGLYVRGMGVLPESRGLKVGLKLLHEVDQYADEKGFQRIFLNTAPFLDSAIKLYENCGFNRIAGSNPDLFGTRLFAMEKLLFPNKVPGLWPSDLFFRS